MKTTQTIILLLGSALLSVHAETFTVDPTASTLTISGMNLFVGAFVPQGPNSLVTVYTGTIDARVCGGAITFNSAAVAASINGTWEPAAGGMAGSAPADYGIAFETVTFPPAFAAVRNLVFNMTSSSIGVTAGGFDSTQITLSASSGTTDYTGPLGSGTIDLTTLASGPNRAMSGLLTINGNVETLTIPIQFSQTFTVISQNDTTATFTGTIVARATIPEPITPSLAVSRKAHGSAGNFDINLPLTGTPGVECRSGGATNNFQIVLAFPSPVTFSSAAVTSGTGSVASTDGSGTPNIAVNLTGVPNAQTIAVTLSCLSSGSTTGNLTISMGLLLGDTNSDGVVNSGDATITRNRSGQGTDATNFRSDFNLDGSVNSADVIAVRARSGSFIP